MILLVSLYFEVWNTSMRLEILSVHKKIFCSWLKKLPCNARKSHKWHCSSSAVIHVRFTAFVHSVNMQQNVERCHVGGGIFDRSRHQSSLFQFGTHQRNRTAWSSNPAVLVPIDSHFLITTGQNHTKRQRSQEFIEIKICMVNRCNNWFYLVINGCQQPFETHEPFHRNWRWQMKKEREKYFFWTQPIWGRPHKTKQTHVTHTLLWLWSKFLGESFSKTLPPGLSEHAPITCHEKYNARQTAVLQEQSYYDFIEIHNCLESMGNSNDGAFGTSRTQNEHEIIGSQTSYVKTDCFRMVFWIASSVSISIAAVASSRSKTLLWRIRARARHRSCRWPTLKFEPPSEITASSSFPGAAAPSCLQKWNEYVS